MQSLLSRGRHDIFANLHCINPKTIRTVLVLYSNFLKAVSTEETKESSHPYLNFPLDPYLVLQFYMKSFMKNTIRIYMQCLYFLFICIVPLTNQEGHTLQSNNQNCFFPRHYHSFFTVNFSKGIVILVMNKTNHYLYHGYYKKNRITLWHIVLTLTSNLW